MSVHPLPQAAAGQSATPITDYEAEAATLGACLLATSQIEPLGVEVGLRAEHFHRIAHATVWTAMAALSDDAQAVDVLTVARRCEATSDHAPGDGWPRFVDSLTGGVPSAGNAAAYGRRVLEVWRWEQSRRSHLEALAAVDARDRGALDAAEQAATRLLADGGGEHLTDPKAGAAHMIGWLEEEPERGLPLPWPQLERAPVRLRPGHLTVLGGWTSTGKALECETPIPTLAGWSTMGDLEAGDEVFDEGGERCTVTAAHDVLHGRFCFAVRFDDGAEIVADTGHLWTTQPDTMDHPVTVTTALLRMTLPARHRITSGGRPPRLVVAVETVASRPVRCIEVDSPSRLFLVGRELIATHNSAAASTLAAHVGHKGGHVVIWDNELTREERWARHVTSQTGVSYNSIVDRDVADRDVHRVVEALRRLPFGVVDAHGWSAQEIARHIRQVRPALAIVDHFHALPGVSRTDEADAAVQVLVAAAGQAKCHVLLVAQLNQARNDKVGRPPPVLRDLRGTGNLSALPSNVIFVHREEEEVRGDDDRPLGRARMLETGHIDVAKQRGGPPASIPARFDEWRLRWLEEAPA